MGVRFSAPARSPILLCGEYRLSFSGVKRPKRNIDHPPHPAPRFKKEWIYTPPLGLHGLSRRNFTSAFTLKSSKSMADGKERGRGFPRCLLLYPHAPSVICVNIHVNRMGGEESITVPGYMEGWVHGTSFRGLTLTSAATSLFMVYLRIVGHY